MKAAPNTSRRGQPRHAEISHAMHIKYSHYDRRNHGQDCNKAQSDKRYRFRNLYRELNEELLLDSWRLLRNDAALRVDRVSAVGYEANLAENFQQKVERLKWKRYGAKLARRHYIPKGNGGMRPLGIPPIEDKLRLLAVKRLLKHLRAGLFGRAVMGYRPLAGARTAVDELRVKLQFGGYHHVVEAGMKASSTTSRTNG